MDKSIFSLILSVLAIMLAGTVAFSMKVDCNIYSFVIGTLTVLVTFLLGWQICSKIEVEKQLNRVKKVVEEIGLLSKKIELESKTAVFVSLAQLGRSAYNKYSMNTESGAMERADAIQSLLNALCLWEKDMNTPLAKEAYEYCITRLPILIKNIKFGVESVDEKDAYVLAMMKTGIRELIDFAIQINVENK